MTVFAIHSRPDDGPEAIAAVPDRFVWTAFILTPVWALAKRAFWFFALWLAVAAGLWFAQTHIGADAALLLYLVFALWSGFAAPAIASRALKRAGWLTHGDLAAPDLETAERMWLERVYGPRA
ncbi:DUF2628 domain-containing protein [Pelagibacterium sediminicola]|uniref:DUF2628 domain-containing protein n=1 Tax=Pelagibacterium sediminicola TaxID=2248761 RepID=UPI000E31EFAC|nr:DUF2628 domain-containing protein [Pelagibacterium sediminicola]